MTTPSPHTPPTDPDHLPEGLAGSMVATGILAFFGLFLETVLNVLFPALMEEFSIGVSDVQWMTSGYLLVISVIMPLSSYLNRRFTARSLFVSAAGAVLVGAVIALLAHHYWVLLAGRIVQAVGTGIVTPLMFNIILERSPRPMVGRLMGLGALSLGIAPALGPIVGGVLGTIASWRWVFGLVIPFALVALLIGLRSVHQGAPTEKLPMRWDAVLALVLAFGGLVFGVERGGAALSGGSGMVGAVALLVVGLVALAAFVVLTLRSTAPLLRLDVLAHPGYTHSLLAFVLLQFSALGLGYLVPTVAQLGHGMAPLSAGLIILPGAALGAVLAPLGGIVLDRMGARVPILGGVVLALCGTLVLVLVSSSTAGMVVGYVVFMAGFGMTFAKTQTHAMSHVSGPETPDGTALINTSQQFFGAMSMTVLSTVLAIGQGGALAGSSAYAADTVSAGRIGFAVVACAMALATFAQVRALRAQPPAGATDGAPRAARPTDARPEPVGSLLAGGTHTEGTTVAVLPVGD